MWLFNEHRGRIGETSSLNPRLTGDSSDSETESPGQGKLQVLCPLFLRALATKCCVALIFCRVHLNYMAADRNSSEKRFSDDENEAAAAAPSAEEENAENGRENQKKR